MGYIFTSRSLEGLPQVGLQPWGRLATAARPMGALHPGTGLAGLRAELAAFPREVSSWQIAMRSFPPRLQSPGNPGGIQLGGSKSKDDERAWRSVPAMWTASMTDLWPVGDQNVIRGYIDRVLDSLNSSLWGGQGMPRVQSVDVAQTGGTPVYIDIPQAGLTQQDMALLSQAAGQGLMALGQVADEMAAVMEGSSDPARARALRFVANSVGQAMATVAVGQYTNATIARDVLQGLSTSMLAVAPSIPYGIGYAIAGVLQIGSWAAGAWDKGAEPAEMIGYSYHWTESQQRQVLRYRLIVQTCADRQSIERGVAAMTIGQVRSWLSKTAYGLDVGPSWEQRLERALLNAMACASNACGDQLDDARLIRQLSNFLWYAGASDEVVEKLDHWLWDARRMQRIHEARQSGEINYKAPYGSIEDIGKFPDYWRDWCYDGKTTPVLFTRDQLLELNAYVRTKFTRQPISSERAAQRRLILPKLTTSAMTWKQWALVIAGLAALGGLAWWLSAPAKED